jgi:hypothetical protein
MEDRFSDSGFHHAQSIHVSEIELQPVVRPLRSPVLGQIDQPQRQLPDPRLEASNTNSVNNPEVFCSKGSSLIVGERVLTFFADSAVFDRTDHLI